MSNPFGRRTSSGPPRGRGAIITLAALSLFAAVIPNSILAWQGELAPVAAPPKLVPVPSSQSAGEFLTEAAVKQATANEPTTHVNPQIRLPSFKDVTPSRTTLDEARQLLGKPEEEAVVGEDTLLSYRIPPFQRVELVGVNGVVTSIVINLREPTPIKDLVSQLEIGQIVSTPIPDETGRMLGQIYPERGILFSTSDDDPTQAVQIVLEPIGAEPFVLRAQYRHRHQYGRRIADLNEALRIEPLNAHIHWLLAKTHLAIGDTGAARQHATEAVRHDETSAAYQLTNALVLAKLGKDDVAIAETKALLASPILSDENRARGECQMGDLLANGNRPQYKVAIEHHQRAIEFATPLANSKDFELRRAAKQILLDAHLGVAEDIALGSWRRKPEVVPKWIGHAQAIAANMITSDAESQELQLGIYNRALMLSAAMDSNEDPAPLVEGAITDAHQLLAASDDPLTRDLLHRRLSDALFHAATLEHRRRRATQAIGYAQQALSYLEQVQTKNHDAFRGYRIGRLQFLIGAVHAIHHQDHPTAIEWYSRAVKELAQGPVPARDRSLHGDRYVAMGVSYWSTGAKRDALELTKQGAHLIQSAVEDGAVPQSALAVPFGNLAGMHRDLGETADARQYADVAARLRANEANIQKR